MTEKEKKVLKDAKSRDYFGESKIYSDSNILDAHELGEQDKLAEVGKELNDLPKYNLSLMKIQKTHSKIDWGRIFLLRLKTELKQKLGIK